MTAARSRVPESARRVPVAADADIVVVGGGPGGFAAALTAARLGASVVLVEKYDMPGGVHTSGLQGAANAGVGGVHSELMQRFAAEGHIYTATEKTHPDWAGNPLAHYEQRLAPDAKFCRSSFSPEGAGCVMVRMLEEAGVHAMYGAAFVDAVVKRGTAGDGRIDAVIVENASGREAVRGKVFIDGSGTAELAARAGVPFVRGGGPQPSGAEWDGVRRPIPGALLWIVCGVDFSRVAAYQRSARDPLLAQPIAEGTVAGDLLPGLYRPRMGGANVYGNYYIGHPTLDMSPILADGTYVMWQNVPYEWGLHMDDDARDAARARSAMREFIDTESRFLRKYVPGFETSYVSGVGRYVGVRDGRHPVGEHVFSLEDAVSGRRFADAVTQPMTKTFHWDGYRQHRFEVPYRSFLPKGIDNLLLTGASLSFTYETIFMVMRNFPWCTQTGEIAGFAAARAVRKDVAPKALDWSAPYF